MFHSHIINAGAPPPMSWHSQKVWLRC